MLIFNQYKGITDSKAEVLKQPLQTAVTVNTFDFELFEVQEKIHIIISVKDFKSIVLHADTLRSHISARYSFPTRPLQLSYGSEGMLCEFTLMTTGEHNGVSLPATGTSTNGINTSTRTASVPGSKASMDTMQPPTVPASRSAARKGNQPVSANSVRERRTGSEPDSLFVPLADEDREWDPQGYRNEDEVLGWDASANDVR